MTVNAHEARTTTECLKTANRDQEAKASLQRIGPRKFVGSTALPAGQCCCQSTALGREHQWNTLQSRTLVANSGSIGRVAEPLREKSSASFLATVSASRRLGWLSARSSEPPPRASCRACCSASRP